MCINKIIFTTFSNITATMSSLQSSVVKLLWIPQCKIQTQNCATAAKFIQNHAQYKLHLLPKLC